MTDTVLVEDDENVQRALANLERATVEVRRAATDLEHAEKDLEHAEAELKEAREHPQKFKVEVIYNGVRKPFEVRAHELVSDLRARAIKEFGPIPQPHLLGLFTEAGQELDDKQTLRAAGVKPHETLLLRPSKVRGGNR